MSINNFFYKGDLMLHISKWERQENASRDKLGTAALNLCKVAKSTDGVHSAKFYWPNPNMVAFVVEAETGSWGIGAEPTGEAMKAFFDLGDAASCVMDETWVDASLGQKRSDRAG